jgi:hypothetical protein
MFNESDRPFLMLFSPTNRHQQIGCLNRLKPSDESPPNMLSFLEQSSLLSLFLNRTNMRAEGGKPSNKRTESVLTSPP